MKIWKVTALGTIFIVVMFLWIFVWGLSANQPGSYYNKGNNAVWLGHEWVGEAKSDIEIQALVRRLKEHDIGTVFVHSGPLKENGDIDPTTYRHSIAFVEKVKQLDADIEYQAWIGQLRGKIDLSDAEVRHNISNQCRTLAYLVGFDGIHFDVEPVWDGDLDFIDTIEECRDVIPKEKKISVALAEFIPESFIWFTEKIHTFENYNTEINYQNVAEHADQVVVMAYDTGLAHDWAYEWLVKEQTIWLTDLLDGTELFVGIPAYDEEKVGFDPEVENIGTGLRGIVKGLNNARSNEENFEGVAIYSYWEMDGDEWGTFKDIWIE
jgi:hypothetical protein